MIGIAGTIALNGGRGRATPQCVWSIHRIDAQLGRYLDINSAWRDPQEQERLYTAYRSYVNGNGPWAPIALSPEQSVHCKGEAIDTDDNNSAMTRTLNDNGWFHTVYRNGVLVEPWHYEYDYKRDKFFGGQPAGSGSTPIEEEDMTPDQSKWLETLYKSHMAFDSAGKPLYAWSQAASNGVTNITPFVEQVRDRTDQVQKGLVNYPHADYNAFEALTNSIRENTDLLRQVLGKLPK